LSGQRIDVVADLSTTPKTLTVSERQVSCKWQAHPEQ
jgi:hypothetical protein